MMEIASKSRSEANMRSDMPAVLRLILGAVLVILVLIIGQPRLDAPWILGDEYLFIVNNPDVSGASPGDSIGRRYLDIFLRTHEDLYQPFTILTYAVQWDLGGDRIRNIRLFDVLIHALNGLLVWTVLSALFRRLSLISRWFNHALAWSLALIWALHPMLVGAWAADMGRTHLLAATFCMLSLLCHVKHLDATCSHTASPSKTWFWFLAAYVLLILAMINKPVVGWFLIVFVLEWIRLGLRVTLSSPRLYLVSATCAAFAILTLATTRDTFALDEMALPIFGDPASRALLGLWIYIRNFFAPLHWLSPWYPPVINTGWGHPAVIAGSVLLIAGAFTAVLSARTNSTRGITLGLIWFAAAWLPISGLVGARVLAAQDRYMYLPMLGLLIALGFGLLAWQQRNPRREKLRAYTLILAVTVLMSSAIPWNRELCREGRSALRRAERAVSQNPNDPRVLEFLAATYDFCRGHEIPEEPTLNPLKYLELTVSTLRDAARLGDASPGYFPDLRSRAEFHRRISYSFWKLGFFQDSLEQAQRAYDFEPEAPITWTRLAHAYRGSERWQDTLAAYEKLYEIVPPDSEARPLRLLEYADLLLNRLDAPAQALPLYYELLGMPELGYELRRLAFLGAARCEVLAGQGSEGYELAMQVFRLERDNLEAARIIALYYLRSHEWELADRAYRAILTHTPTDYEVLRGFQNVCIHTGEWREAAFAWQKAYEAVPNDLIFRSHFVWSAACAGEPAAARWAEELLEIAPDNRHACLAKMLVELRAERIDAALEWIRRAAGGPELPLARELVRAEATLEKMIERGELSREALLARAALQQAAGNPDRCRSLLRDYLDAEPDSAWRSLAESMLVQEMHPETAP